VNPSPNVFDELFARLTPDRLIRDEAATGEGISIAVVDSGIERDVITSRHPNAVPIEGAIFAPSFAPYLGKQSSPHGTTVADVLLRIAPKAKLFSADVFGPQGNSEVETVIAAIRHAIDVWKVKIINLSLGVPEHKLQQMPKRNLLRRAVEEAYYQDVLVFAAANNEHPLSLSYPAAFGTPLISVDKGLFDDPLQFVYQLHEHIEFRAHSRGYLGPFAQEPATSWATPHLAGIAARILTLRPNLKPFEMKTLLYWMFPKR
jgi:subtilisin family serine protease